MSLIILYSFLLIAGILVSQIIDLSSIRDPVTLLTVLFLAYIMLEVGLEFTLHKDRLSQYGWDFFVATTAALFPWIFWIAYFVLVFQVNWSEASLVGRAAAPTSAGVLFSMLSAAGLGATWLFRKARILAIFDDLDTILWMIPLQIILLGMKLELIAVIFIIVPLLVIAYIWLNRLHWPIGRFWLLLYSVIIVAFITLIEHTTNIHIEVLLPAFTLGCLLYNPLHDPQSAGKQAHLDSLSCAWSMNLDKFIKGMFMFLVGCSLPKIQMNGLSGGEIVFHLMMLTVLSNIGKCFPLFCYRKEADFKTRLALCIAMFPRGEVGAGVLLVAIASGIGGVVVGLSVLSLALNLLLTGVFVALVVRLVGIK